MTLTSFSYSTRESSSDVALQALARAQTAGADEALDAREGDIAKKIKSLTDGLGVDLAMQFVGRAATVTEGLKSLRRGGRLVVAPGGGEV